MTQISKWGGVALGCALLLFLHLYRLSSIPGLHYDEAWAMNYSWSIGGGFWPLTAMSPYTAPWTHYWASLWMHVLGPSVLVFRASQVTLSLLGLLALCFSLPKHLRAAFPWAILLLPGLILNHRFAIELTGFHVLAFGMMCWAIRSQRFALACFAALAGTTAHILFYGVGLALIGTVFLSEKVLPAAARRGAMVYFSFMALFFVRVLLVIPEKGKAGALVLSSILLVGLLWAEAEKWAVWKSAWWRVALTVGSAVFVFNCLFFAQGYWSLSIFTGINFIHGKIIGIFFVALMCLFMIVAISWRAAPPFLSTAFLALTFACGVLMLKPAPRYFELPFLCLLLLLVSWNLTEWNLKKVLRLILAANLLVSFSVLHWYTSADQPLHFLFFKDSSRDFLDKQSLARHLGGSGCELNDIHSGDPRLMEALKALSLGDWPVNRTKPCAYNVVARRSDGSGPGDVFGEFLLRRKP